MNPSGSAPAWSRPVRRVCQFGVSSRRLGQRWVRQEFATSPRSRTRWSMERSVRRRLMARPACPAPTTTAVVWITAGSWWSGQLDQDLGRVGHHVEDRGALLRLGEQRLQVLAGGVGVDGEPDRDRVEAVADVGVGAQDAQDVHLPFDGGGDRPELDAAELSDRGDPSGQAAGQADQHDLHRGGAVVLGGEALGVVDVVLVGGAVLLLGAQAGEPVHGGVAVGALSPGAGGPPGELGRFRRGRERFACPEQGLDVHAVFDGVVGDGHRYLLGCQDETVVRVQAVTGVSGNPPTWMYESARTSLRLGERWRRRGMPSYARLWPPGCTDRGMGGAVRCETRDGYRTVACRRRLTSS